MLMYAYIFLIHVCIHMLIHVCIHILVHVCIHLWQDVEITWQDVEITLVCLKIRQEIVQLKDCL